MPRNGFNYANIGLFLPASLNLTVIVLQSERFHPSESAGKTRSWDRHRVRVNVVPIKSKSTHRLVDEGVPEQLIRQTMKR